MKKTISCMLCFLMTLSLVGCATVSAKSTNKTSNDWQEGYISVLDDLRKSVPGYGSNSDEYTADTPEGYLLYDIDKDGTPEMIVKRGTCEADYTGEIYALTGSGYGLIEADLPLGHTNLYTDPEGGILFYQAHMGQATLQRATFNVGKLKFEDLFQEGDSEMVDEYTPVQSIVKDAAVLTFGRMYQNLGVNRYNDILTAMVETGQDYAKEEDPEKELSDAMDQVITYGGAVDAINVYGNVTDPGTKPFDELLKNLDPYSDDVYKVDSTSYRDIDGDGRQECLLRLVKDNKNQPDDKFAIINLQDGKMYAYIIDYINTYKIGDDGVFAGTDEYDYPFRVIFDKDECLLFFVTK